MKAEFVNPFIESVYDLFRTMLSSQVTRTGLALSANEMRPREIMALIGFSGMVKGTAALALPSSTCSAMANRLLGTDESSDEEVSDTISEMVNIVAGAAKSKISESIGEVLELSLPVVLRGESFEVYSPSNAMWLEVPFSSDLGDFTLRLSFEATFATP